MISEREPGKVPFKADTIRVATFNVEDVRTDDLKNPHHPRLKGIATIIQEIRPDIILLNEIAYDQSGAPGYEPGDSPGQNGKRLVENFLNFPQQPGLQPLRYRAFMALSNTGIPSGFDLNNDGKIVTVSPVPPPASADGKPGPQTTQGRLYGVDCWGFGTFPGQYAMVLLVKEEFQLLEEEIRTFQKLTWKSMPEALLPIDPQSGASWYSDAELEVFRLSSKSHWDVPVQLPGGKILHLLCSHPTPPAFDGKEERNKRRNHDEIRLWADYINGSGYIIDDLGKAAGLEPEASFLILGDLNADPNKGASIHNPITKFLLEHPRINGDFIPQADSTLENLDPDDTARWGLRVDYLLPSANIKVLRGGIWRRTEFGSGNDYVSDHFPVWLDIIY